jgi:hypothetical protein
MTTGTTCRTEARSQEEKGCKVGSVGAGDRSHSADESNKETKTLQRPGKYFFWVSATLIGVLAVGMGFGEVGLSDWSGLD